MGVGLLVGGIIFNVTGSKLADKAGEAFSQAERTKKEVNKIVRYFDELTSVAKSFKTSLTEVEKQYRKRLAILDHVVNFSEKVQWSEFTAKEKQMTENVVLLVGLLYKMCKTSLVLKDQNGDGLNAVNKNDVDAMVADANKVLNEVKDVA